MSQPAPFELTLHFGLDFDERPVPLPNQHTEGHLYLGPAKLLAFCMEGLGIGALKDNISHIRTEQYRQLIKKYLGSHTRVFFKDSFGHAPFATAEKLLQMRDELLIASWSFDVETPMPDRLRALAEMEALLHDDDSLKLRPAQAEMNRFLLQHDLLNKLFVREIFIYDPEKIIPRHWLELFDAFKKAGATIAYRHAELNVSLTDTDLDAFKAFLNGETKKTKLNGDGSLLIIKGDNAQDNADFIARLYQLNPTFQPLAILPEKNNELENTFILQGLPAMGVPSASNARPGLQIIKLLPNFLWKPLDPFKVLDIMGLAQKPFDDRLADLIAEHMAKMPGINSESWHIMIYSYFKELEERDGDQAEEVKRQYRFWFERKRYSKDSKVPKGDIIQLYRHLSHWSLQAYEESGNRNNSLLSVYRQAVSIIELLDINPEQELDAAELEHIIQVIYDPSTVQLRQEEQGAIPFTHSPGAIAESIDQLLWWNFIENEHPHFFSLWYKEELAFLQKRNVELSLPEQENQRLLWKRKQAVFRAQKQLMIVIPEKVRGEQVLPHPLYDNLQAAFHDLERITHRVLIDDEQSFLAQYFSLPQNSHLAQRPIPATSAFVQLPQSVNLDPDYMDETYSGMDQFLYYPYQWYFRKVLKLKAASVLRMVSDVTLKGNLAHRTIEKLLEKNDIHRLNKEKTYQLAEEELKLLMQREGSLFLMYGKETERVKFTHQVKYAAWSLVELIQNNNWQLLECEMKLEGQFLNLHLRGRADLVLQRGNGEKAIIDLKWRGKGFRQTQLKNEEDLQLALYTHLLPDADDKVSTAFFILNKGELIGRNPKAFDHVPLVESTEQPFDIHKRIIQKIQKTHQWRARQLKEQQLEIRCADTIDAIEAHYEEDNNMLELLELKTEDARFDDYRVLIGLVK